jgi:hypothetical protein
MNPLEHRTIAGECAAAYGRTLDWYRTHFKMNTEQAVARMGENAEEYAQEILRRPPEEINWYEINHVSQLDALKGLELWDEIKIHALEELRSGHRSAKALQPVANHPWVRAQFLALRYELAEEWQPQNGIERQLIDTMAMAQSCCLQWAETLALRTCRDSVSRKKLAEEPPWTPPRMSEAEAIEQAAAMMDRFNKIFLRSLRALRDLRRYSRPVFVQNAGQVNVGGQQVNVNGHVNGKKGRAEEKERSKDDLPRGRPALHQGRG